MYDAIGIRKGVRRKYHRRVGTNHLLVQTSHVIVSFGSHRQCACGGLEKGGFHEVDALSKKAGGWSPRLKAQLRKCLRVAVFVQQKGLDGTSGAKRKTLNSLRSSFGSSGDRAAFTAKLTLSNRERFDMNKHQYIHKALTISALMLSIISVVRSSTRSRPTKGLVSYPITKLNTAKNRVDTTRQFLS